MKELTIKDLNPVLVARFGHAAIEVYLNMANLANESQLVNSHEYAIGDCLLAKLNLLKKGKRIRKHKPRLIKPSSKKYRALT